MIACGETSGDSRSDAAGAARDQDHSRVGQNHQLETLVMWRSRSVELGGLCNVTASTHLPSIKISAGRKRAL